MGNLAEVFRLLWSPGSLATVAARCSIPLGTIAGIVAWIAEIGLVLSVLTTGWLEGFPGLYSYLTAVYGWIAVLTLIYSPSFVILLISLSLFVWFCGQSGTRVGATYRVFLLGPICLFLPILIWSTVAVLEQAAHPGTEVKIAAALKWLSNPAIKIIASRWCLGVMVTLLLLVWLVALHRLGGALDEVNEPRCKNCKYSLVGIDSSRCPECGWGGDDEDKGMEPTKQSA